MISFWFSNILFACTLANGLPYDPCGPPCLIYCLSVVFPIACMVLLPTDSCGLPYAVYYLLMVFPVTLVVRPI